MEEAIKDDHKLALLGDLDTLLRGSAANWFNLQLTKEERIVLRTNPTGLVTRLTLQFGVKVRDALEWFESPKGRYSFEDIRNDRPIRAFANDIFKYARVYGDNTEYQQLLRFHRALHLRLQESCSIPKETTSRSDYLDEIEAKQKIIRNGLLETDKPKPSLARPAFHADDFQVDIDNNATDQSDDGGVYFNDQRRPQWGRPRPRYWNKSEESARELPERKDNRREDPPGSGHRAEPDRRPYRGNWPRGANPQRDIDQPYAKDDRYDQRPRNAERGTRFRPVKRFGRGMRRENGFVVYEDVATVKGDGEAEQLEEQRLKSEGYVCVERSYEDTYPSEAFHADTPEEYGYFLGPKQPPHGQRYRYRIKTCQVCSKELLSAEDERIHRQEHQSNKFASGSTTTTPVGSKDNRDVPTAATLNPTKEDRIVEAMPNPTFTGQKSTVKTSYLKIPIRANPNGEDTMVCLDTGCSTVLVDRTFAKEWARKPQFEQTSPHVVAGIKSATQITEQVNFDFYMRGEVADERTIIGHFSVKADVIDNLEPKMLVGTRFLAAHGAKIDFNKEQCTFRSAHNMKVKGEVTRKPRREVTRKVTAAYTTVIPALQDAFIPVNYVDLPTGKPDNPAAYHFTSSEEAILDATINSQTPKYVIFRNNTLDNISITKGARVGRIAEYDGNEVAMIVRENEAGAIEEWLREETPNPQAAQAYLDELDKTLEASYTAIPPSDTKENQDPPKTNSTPSYGINKPDNLPRILSKAGVSVCQADPDLAGKVVALLDRFDVFRDRGIVPMPDDQKMRIELVDGWQNQRRNIKAYPLGRKDREFIDKEHGKLHDNGKIRFMDKPSPIACPLFVVWRTVDGKPKGRAVVDLRPLNKIAVPDVYPLPDQDDIIGGIAGKRYITILDAAGFFHQLPVHPDHQDRMVMISPRGLEQSNVVLMGFKNSPAFAQRFMDRLLRDYRDFVKAYIDDICIFSDTAEEHLQHLETVLRILEESRIHISAAKSFAAYPSVKLLGYTVDGNGIQRTEDRIEAFRKLKKPETLLELETYLGMAGWLRTSIPWYNVKVGPLQARKTALFREGRTTGELPAGASKNARTAYTRKTKWTMTEEETESWNLLQTHLGDQMLLYHHVTAKPLFLKADACRRGYAVMALQLRGNWDGVSIPGKDIPREEICPILFLSRETSAVEKRYGSTEAEVACVVWACRKLRKMIQSNANPVNILTDHAATRGIVTHTSLITADLAKANLKLANAANYLSQFELKIFHIPGTLNVVPDALSRLPTFAEVDKREDVGELEEIYYTTWHEVDDQGFIADYATATPVLGKELSDKLKDGYFKDRKLKRIVTALQSYEEKEQQALGKKKEREKGRNKPRCARPTSKNAKNGSIRTARRTAVQRRSYRRTPLMYPT